MSAMEIQHISVYRYDMPLKIPFKYRGGKVIESLDSTVVEVTTNTGVKGYGEVGTMGDNSFLPSYPNGIRAGLRELAPSLIGDNPLELEKLNTKMDGLLRGHLDAKSGIDMACWDILGKVHNRPVSSLLGGSYQSSVPVYACICVHSKEELMKMITQSKNDGVMIYQVKVGDDYHRDVEKIKNARALINDKDILICDANRGWLPSEALRICRACSDLDIYLEQPCNTYEECLQLRQHTNLPILMDELAYDMSSVAKCYNDRAAEGIVIKFAKMGGLTKAKQIRDFCVSIGMCLKVDDAWAGDIATAAIAHFAQSVPPKFCLTTIDCNTYFDVSVAKGAPTCTNGRLAASTKPGLGIEPNFDVLKEPVFAL